MGLLPLAGAAAGYYPADMRRSLALLALWSASPAFGGPIGPRAAPGQLALPFDAASAPLSAPISSALSPAPALAAAPPAADVALPLPLPAAPAPGQDLGASRRRTTKIDYDAFGRQLGLNPGLSLNIFGATDAKRGILAASGYTHLVGAGGRRIALADATAARIGAAFDKILRTFNNRSR